MVDYLPVLTSPFVVPVSVRISSDAAWISLVWFAGFPPQPVLLVSLDKIYETFFC